MELTFREKFLMAEFKSSAIYDSVEEACELNLLTDMPSRLCDEERGRYGVFTGNCLIIETKVPRINESRFFTYVFDPLGYPTLIPESAKHSRSLTEATEWIESDDFRANKTLYIAAAALMPHEHHEDDVFTACKGLVKDPLFRRHRRFRMEYEAWLAEQVDEDGESIF